MAMGLGAALDAAETGMWKGEVRLDKAVRAVPELEGALEGPADDDGCDGTGAPHGEGRAPSDAASGLEAAGNLAAAGLAACAFCC
jgi:hypothetical protein